MAVIVIVIVIVIVAVIVIVVTVEQGRKEVTLTAAEETCHQRRLQPILPQRKLDWQRSAFSHGSRTDNEILGIS